MKKTVLSFSLLLCLGFLSAKAQTFVSTSPSNRNVVLEEFTGVNCQYCPDGHKRANQLAAANPDRVVILNIHQGGYANTTPDYRTQWGDAIASQTGLSGYPAGTINRHVFTGTVTALNRGDWTTYASQIMTQSSYVNVAAQSTINWGTRELTITVEAYYTDNSDSLTNLLNVALLQENVIGPQVGASTWYPAMMTSDGQYKHNHMLRNLITGQWGDTIYTTTQGSFFTKTYTYTIPDAIKNVPLYLENLTVAVFITKGKQEIITGAMSSMTNVYSTTPDFRIESVKQITYGSCLDSLTQAKVYLTNISNANISSYELTYVVNGAGNTDSIVTVTGKSFNLLEKDSILLPPFKTVPNQTKTLTVTATKANGSVLNSQVTKNISLTKNMAETWLPNLKLRLWQDAYGSETTWKLFDVNGNVVKSGGPYLDLSTSTTKLHEIDLGVTGGCYRFEIYDSYGDGINTGSGSGKYEIWGYNGIDSVRIISSNGKYGYGEQRFIQTGFEIGIDKVSPTTISNVFIYPNPVKENATIKLSLANATSVVISVIDVMGKEVVKATKVAYGKGEHDIPIKTQSLANGTYIIKIQTTEGVVSKRIIVAK